MAEQLHPDLFGGETRMGETRMVEPQPSHEGRYQLWKKYYHYRKAEDEYKRCAHCDHFLGAKGGVAGTYFKCEKMGATGSSATDVRKGHVCDLFEVEMPL